MNGIYNAFEPGLGSSAYDTFYVLDPEGRVTLRDLRPNSSSDFPKLRQAVDEALGTVPVERATWGRIKTRY